MPSPLAHDTHCPLKDKANAQKTRCQVPKTRCNIFHIFEKQTLLQYCWYLDGTFVIWDGLVKMPLCLHDHILECLPKKLWKISWLNQGKWEDAGEYFLARMKKFTKIIKVHSNMNKKVRENDINFPWAEDMRPSENIKMLYLFQQMWSEVAFDGKSNPMIGLKLFSLPRLNIL